MKKKLLVLAFGLLVILTTACGKNPKLKNGEEIVVKVDGFKISADKLYKELKAKYGYNVAINMIDEYIANKEIPDSDKIDEYVNSTVEYYTSYAASAGMELEDFLAYNGIDTVDEFKTTLKNQRKLELAIKKQVGKSFTDEEIEAYYNDNYSEKLTVKHILIKFDEDEDEYDEAYNTALNIIGKLKEAKKKDLNKTFDDLALEYSADSTYNNGGLIEGFMANEVVPEFWEASKNLKADEFTDTPVKTTYGYHVILKVSEEDKKELKDAKDDIREKLAEQKLQQDALLQNTTLVELRKKYKLTIYDTDIEKGYNSFKESLEK